MPDALCRRLTILLSATKTKVVKTGREMASAEKETLFKFPRTRHLFDAGGSGVSRDDLLLDEGEEAVFYSGRSAGSRARGRRPGRLVCIEEKVDGANLGISVGEDLQLRVQNRSHFVNSKTHAQFSTLESWLEENSGTLYELLESKNLVLFGEWLYAKHSIHYTRLPGHFMAFDIFDRSAGKFFSWRERNRQLEGTGIPVVRRISETTIDGRKDVSLFTLLTPSSSLVESVWSTDPLTHKHNTQNDKSWSTCLKAGPAFFYTFDCRHHLL